MSVKNRIASWFTKRSQLTSPEPWLLNALGYRPTGSGKHVDEQTALTFSAVFACVSVLSRNLAALPLVVYERLDRGRRRARETPIYKLLHSVPNSEMTSYTLRSTLMAHLALWGNAYMELEHDNRGNVIALWMLPPWRTEPRRTDQGTLYYEIKLPNGAEKNLPASQVLHILGLGIDGLKGLSPIALHRQGIGLGLAAEEFGAMFFGQGTNIGGIIELPHKMKDTTLARLRKDIQEKHEGLGRSHRLLFLEEGLKYHRMGMPLTDAQFLESRKFQKTEIASIYNVPPHMIGDLERATFSNIEHQGIEFLRHTMTPWLVNWEQELNRKLFDTDDYYVEFLVEGLLRGESQARAEYYNRMFNVGAYSINDIREKENENPIGPEGDEYFVPLNMVPAKLAAQGEAVEPSAAENKATDSIVERRSSKSRMLVARSFKKVFIDAGRRIIKREEADIMRKAKELLGNRNNRQAFETWLETFFEQHQDYAKRQMLPAVSALAEAIQAEVAQEINIDVEVTPELEKFISDYVDAFAARHIKSSRGQLLQVVAQAREEGEDEVEALQTRFDEWEERRPNKIADREVVQGNGAIARFVMAAAGITMLIVRNTGSKTCEFCQTMDGKVVGIEQPFIPADSSISGKDSNGNNLTVYGPKYHPPFHQNCVCSVEAHKK